jgi:hypothetical protein
VKSSHSQTKQCLPSYSLSPLKSFKCSQIKSASCRIN